MKCTGSEIVPASGALLYKTGLLVRKVHADCDGKRSTFHYSLLLSIEVQQLFTEQRACVDCVEYGAARIH